MAQFSDQPQSAFFDLSPRLKLRVNGTDAFRFLNGQISNDLRKATRDSAIQACVLTAKGKLNGVVFVSVESDSFLLDSDPEVTTDLPMRFERYIVADDVQIEDLTERFGIFHLIGEMTQFVQSTRSLRTTRFGSPGWDIWFERADYERAFEQLSRSHSFCDDQCSEILRVENGIPRWARELTGEIIPIEANLETSSIDYTKGCYIGQEVISRIKSSGQTNKRLSALVSLSGESLQPALRLITNDKDAKEVGWITSAVRSERLGLQIALGYLKRGYTTIGGRFEAVPIDNPQSASDLPVEVVELPFLSK